MFNSGKFEHMKITFFFFEIYYKVLDFFEIIHVNNRNGYINISQNSNKLPVDHIARWYQTDRQSTMYAICGRVSKNKQHNDQNNGLVGMWAKSGLNAYINRIKTQLNQEWHGPSRTALN